MLPGKVDWNLWRDIFTDQAVWAEPAGVVLSRHGLVPIAMDPGFPGTSAAFAVRCAQSGSRRAATETEVVQPLHLVIKFYPPMVRGDYEAELEVRSALQSRGSKLPFPRILFSGVLRDAIDWPYIVEEFRPGKATREIWHEMGRLDRDSLARKTAAILAELHSTPLGLLPRLATEGRAWNSHALRQAKICMEAISAKEMTPGIRLPGSLVVSLRHFLDSKASDLIENLAGSPLSLIHNDMTEDHVLVSREGGPESPWEVTALLDFGDATVGPVQEEWVVLRVGLFEMDEEAMRVFLDEYRDLTSGVSGRAKVTHPADPVFRDTMLLLTLVHQFGAEIIAEAIRRTRVDPSTLTDARALMNLLWPIPA